MTSSISPGRSRCVDDRREVVDEALELARQLVDAEHEHDRRLRGELDLGVEVRAQRGGHRVAGRAGAAHVDHDPQRVAVGDAGPADLLVADDAAAGDLVDRRGGAARERRSCCSAAPRRAARAGGGRRRARASAARTATSSASAAACGRPASGSIRPESDTCSSARLGQRAGDLVHRREHRVGADATARSAAGRGGSRSAGPTTGRRPAGRRPRARPRRSPRRRRPCRSRWGRR